MRYNSLIINNFIGNLKITHWVSTLRAGLHAFPGAWLRCNSLEWNDHSASLRLVMHPENRTLRPVQPRNLGLTMGKPNFSLGVSIAMPIVLSVLAGCAGTPRQAPPPVDVTPTPASPPTPPVTHVTPERVKVKTGGYYKDDGPGDDPPPNLEAVPDAVPKLEPLHRFANRPYVALGQAYTPDTELHPYRETGAASWYGRRYHGSRTSSGEPYDMYAMTAAHRTLPIPSYARVTNVANNKSVVIRINDRGPFHNDRLIDVSYTAAYKLGILQNGSLPVQVETLDPRNPIATSLLPVKPDTVATPPRQPNTAPSITTTPENGGIYVQLGAFGVQENAEQLRAKLAMDLAQLGDKLQVLPLGGMFKVRAGPYPGTHEASLAAADIRRALNINAVVIAR